MSSSSQSEIVVERRGIPTKCLCGRDVKFFTSKTQENPGRPFYRCVSLKKDHLFKWVEDVLCEEIEDLLPKLGIIEREVGNVKTELELLKDLVAELKEGFTLYKMENQKWKALITMAYVLLFLLTIVVAYLMFGKSNNKLVSDF